MCIENTVYMPRFVVIYNQYLYKLQKVFMIIIQFFSYPNHWFAYSTKLYPQFIYIYLHHLLHFPV